MRIEGITKQWLRHGKPGPPTRIGQGWVPLKDAQARAAVAMKTEVAIEDLVEAILTSLDYGPQATKGSVFQVRGFTLEEMVAMSPELGALGLESGTSFVWVRANPKAGTTPHAMDPWGIVKDPWEEGRAAASSGWRGNKEAKQWKSDASSWQS